LIQKFDSPVAYKKLFMIPLHLRISGFLSYLDPAELDFTSFDLACVSGHNGAGKSSLLDAITWSLFGEARGKSSDVINISPEVKAAEVTFTFEHEHNTYRVQRTLPRNKSTVLEFQVLDRGSQTTDHDSSIVKGSWKPLTEKTTRDTQARIEQTLRLDYETFVNASFFLQGKADQFTQQNATKRKEVLSNILGLEVWEEYKNRTADERKAIEREVEIIEARVAEIDSELAEEETRKNRLAELQRALDQLSVGREAQESILENIKKTAALLNEQRKLTSTLFAGLERSRTALSGLESRLATKQADQATYADLVNRAKEIESTYKTWQKARKELEEWEKTASRFREHEKERAPLQTAIASARARLEEEQRSLLLAEEEEIQNQSSVIKELESDLAKAQADLDVAEAKLAERLDIENQRNAARERQAAMKVENDSLKAEMSRLKERIETLQSAEGATCPLCGQELSEEHRKATLEQLEVEGKQEGDAYRANQKETTDLAAQIKDYELQISKRASAENDRIRCVKEVSQISERLKQLHHMVAEWEAVGKKRLAKVDDVLKNNQFAEAEQKRLTKLDQELAKLGYDAAAHDATRHQENELRGVEEEYSNLKSAKEVSKQIAGEIENLETEISARKKETDQLEHEYETAASALKAAEAQSPNLDEAERELFRLRAEENRVRGELGGAKQRVDILKDQRVRKANFEQERVDLQRQIAQHKTLERAFGKDGVPALLIEQALPQIEDKANDLLDRLSGGQMFIEFVTQETYKDEKRKDLKETLDIKIKDGAGTRAYEMYSGGEAFRVNFAVRLALSEILAQRKGARLQTLVIDEGFGSQDALGRQRLIEAINLVRNDFAKILVITHLDELKDAFPTRIEVEKTDRGSTIRVI
jgi:DNA repair protein SbcC/Rad50